MYPFTVAGSAAFRKGKRYCQVQRCSSVRCGYAPFFTLLIVDPFCQQVMNRE
jgi:hypothetical protein